MQRKEAPQAPLFCATPHPPTHCAIRSNRQAQCGGCAERPQPCLRGYGQRLTLGPEQAQSRRRRQSSWHRWWRSMPIGANTSGTTRKTPSGAGRHEDRPPGYRARRLPKGPSPPGNGRSAKGHKATGFSVSGAGTRACLVARFADVEKRRGQPRASGFFIGRQAAGRLDVVRQDDGGQA